MSCEECGRPAMHLWGMDYTPLCEEHYLEAERNYEALAIQNVPDVPA